MAENFEPRLNNDSLLLAGVSDLADAYTRLSAAGDPQRRGKDFEHLLQRAFQLAHFEVELNPRIAHPRQTDLSARYGDHRYLLEAKWQAAKADMDVLGGLRDRLRRTSADVVGVLVSISGFTGTLIEEISRERQTPILLVDQEDLLGALREPTTLPGLLRAKHEALITHGQVHLGESRRAHAATRRPDRALPLRDLHLRDAGGEQHPYLTVPGGFAPVVFATAVTNVDWSFGRGRGMCIDIPPSKPILQMT
ncbi:restriction endonuclease [Streptomyces sp. NPDC096080]|uniref:restriction endonuclease n=1 Tax=Streptomyces sp. NPDC096080 TaxID=3156693 RepID=UPI003327A0F8